MKSIKEASSFEYFYDIKPSRPISRWVVFFDSEMVGEKMFAVVSIFALKSLLLSERTSVHCIISYACSPLFSGSLTLLLYWEAYMWMRCSSGRADLRFICELYRFFTWLRVRFFRISLAILDQARPYSYTSMNNSASSSSLHFSLLLGASCW